MRNGNVTRAVTLVVLLAVVVVAVAQWMWWPPSGAWEEIGPKPQMAMARLFAAPAGKDGKTAKLRVEPVWSTAGKAVGEEVGAIQGMAETEGGEIWLSDPMNGRVLALDARGDRSRVAARRGEGPGEVGGPSLVARHPEGGVAILDLAQAAVQRFGADGRFRERVPVSLVHNPKGFAVLPTGEYVLSGGIPGIPGSIHRFSPRGRRLASWHPGPRTRNPRAELLVAGGALAAAPDGSLLFSQAAPHRILRFLHGEAGRVETVAEDPRLLRPVGDDFIRVEGGVRRFRWAFPQSRAVFPRRDGSVLNVVRNAEAGFSLWEVYAPDGRLLGRDSVGVAYEPWAMTRDGDVLASYRDPETHESVAVRLRVAME